MNRKIRIVILPIFIYLFSLGVTFADTVIPQDTTYHGLLYGHTNVWFAVPVNADGNLSVTLTPSDGVNMQLMLCTPEKNEIIRGDCWGNPLTLSVNGVKPDSFYIRLWGYYGSSENHGFTLTTEFAVAVLQNDNEPNNIFADANLLPLNNTLTGHIGYDGHWASNPADVIDWWKITTTGDGILTVTITQVEPVNLQLAIYRPNGETHVVYADTWGDTTSLTINNLRDGTYFIRVYRYAWNFTPYTLGNVFTPAPGGNDPEPNDSKENASELINGILSEGHLGYNGFRDNFGLDGVDWWHFTLQDTSNLQLTLTQTASANLRPQLFKEDGVTVVHNGGDTWGGGYVMNVSDVLPGSYYLKVITYGVFDSYSLLLLISSVSGIDDGKTSEVPIRFELAQNFPNPFNPATTITFDLPNEELVILKIYNILGQEVAALVNEVRAAGRYSETFHASDLPSGIYIYMLTAGEFTSSKNMMFIK
ncbi:MAG: hypothetical protein CO127_00835 [Ignavibacteria bacterium CG_4_9_14_3_um_filter_36_18]|nr:MAG: hypothetical protein CO127_00835 [Ignavibacteria bacterium CG_4_9_14_3_um_filter_36_18]